MLLENRRHFYNFPTLMSLTAGTWHQWQWQKVGTAATLYRKERKCFVQACAQQVVTLSILVSGVQVMLDTISLDTPLYSPHSL